MSEAGDAFVFPDGSSAQTAKELIQWCGGNEGHVLAYLESGAFAAWFAKAGRDDLVKVAADALDHGRDEAEKISLFLGFAKIAEYYQDSLGRAFTFLLVGRTGVGKSSTINTLLGKEVAAVGGSVPVTSEVVSYSTEIVGIPCRVVDTPGLCDGKRMDDGYIDKIHAAVGADGVDCVWFVTPLTETRVRDDELTAIRTLTRAFGPALWERSVVVLTFADYLSKPARYAAQLAVRPVELRTAIAASRGGAPEREVGAQIALGIPFVAVTNDQDTTPDGGHWLGRLYVETLDRMSVGGFGPLFLALLERTQTAAPADPSQRPPAADASRNPTTNVYISQPIVIDVPVQQRYETVVNNQIERATSFRPQGAFGLAVSVVKAAGRAIKRFFS
jgi:AIG1 family